MDDYNEELIYNALPSHLFSELKNAKSVVLKPNWVQESHLDKPDEWEYVITHPAVLSAVLKKSVDLLPKGSNLIIADSPETAANFDLILKTINFIPCNSKLT